MTNPFLRDGALLPLASLNKLPLAGRDGTAQQMCRASVLAECMQRSLSVCGLPTGVDWFTQFSDLLDDPRTAVCAAQGVDACAAGLTALLLTLKQPGPHRQGGPWVPAHWAYWDTVTQITLGGGLMGGAFGAALLASVHTQLTAAGLTGLTLTAAVHAPVCALLGAAKRASQAAVPALVFDFGHSYLKQGWLTQTDGAFVLRTAPVVPAAFMEQGTDNLPSARALAAHLTGVIAQLYRQVQAAGGEPGTEIVASIANYVGSDGSIAARGGYGKLGLLGEPFAQRLARDVSQAVGRGVHIQLMHDGMAGACAAQGGTPRAEAFIGLGTSLSVGFPVPEAAFDFPCQVAALCSREGT